MVVEFLKNFLIGLVIILGTVVLGLPILIGLLWVINKFWVFFMYSFLACVAVIIIASIGRDFRNE